jgi:hypothetical protein
MVWQSFIVEVMLKVISVGSPAIRHIHVNMMLPLHVEYISLLSINTLFLTRLSEVTLVLHASFLWNYILQQHALLHELPFHPVQKNETDMKPLDMMQIFCSVGHEQG